MDMTGENRIEAPRERVWQALNDPEVLKASIAGCEELEKVSDTEFTAKVRAKVGPVSARFAGRVTLHDLDPPSGYRIEGEGTGGAAGFAKGGASVRLEADGDATVLRYEAKATVGGKLAQIGSRLIQGTARKMADDFFSKFAAHVSGQPPTASEVQTAEPAGAADRAPPPEAAGASARGAPREPSPDPDPAPDSPSTAPVEPAPAPARPIPGPAAVRAEIPSDAEVPRDPIAGPTSWPDAKPPPAAEPPPTPHGEPVGGTRAAVEGWSGEGRAPDPRPRLTPWVIGGVVVLVIIVLALVL